MRSRVLRGALMFAAAIIGRAAAVGAQEVGWHGKAEVSGNVLFGSGRGRLLSGALGGSRADSTWERRLDGQFTYADTRSEDGIREVTARSSRLTAAVDYRPFARISPFWFGSTEANLQQRIDRRWASGAGAKLTLYLHEEDEASVSLAALWERTRALPTDAGVQNVTTRARWSLRARGKRRLSEALRISHVTFFQPSVNRLSRYTADSNTSLDIIVTKQLSGTVSLRDRYDSEARGRGARSNHDGQLLFGVRAGF
ncbi:MAG: DUF481 domain-containing protein [Gemmatimonadaceae bacterium]